MKLSKRGDNYKDFSKFVLHSRLIILNTEEQKKTIT